MATWESLLQLAVASRGFDAVRPDLLAYDRVAQLIDHHRNCAPVAEPDATAILEAFPVADPVGPFRLTAPHLDVHRRAVRALQLHLREDDIGGRQLAAPYINGLEAWLTPIEFADLFAASDERLLLDEALDASMRILTLPYVMPGEWADVYPGSSESRTPGWLRDHVVTGGARSQKYTTGSLHTWILVSEGPWDRVRVERVLRELERIGVVLLDRGFDLKVFLPEFAGDLAEQAIDYHYHFDDPDELRGVLVMLATGMVRFEAFALEGGALSFLGARSIELPADLVGRMHTMVRPVLGSDPSQALAQLGMRKLCLAQDALQAEARFVGSENARYEQLWNLSIVQRQDDWTAGALEEFNAARRGYLAAESRLARLLLGGQPVDEARIVDAPRREFEVAVAGRPNRWKGTEIRLDVLEDGQAFLHLDYRDGTLDWTAAGVGADGPWYHWTASEVDERVVESINAFRRTRHGAAIGQHSRTAERATVIDALVAVLSESVAEMAERLAGQHVTSIVASPGADVDGVPIHLLDFGESVPSSSISYAPSTSFLAAITSGQRPSDEVAVIAYAGRENDIPNVRVEAAVVAGLQRGATRLVEDAGPDDVLASVAARVIHVACHGLAIGRLGLRGLMLSPGDGSGFLSAADILATDGFFDTDVVFLSACSSSVADHAETLIQSFGGVDFAFLAAGARSVVASQWDVGDVAALIYAAEFHATLIDTGSTRHAYGAAQSALLTDLVSLSDRAREALDRGWPSWHASWLRVPARTHAVHWGAFRLAGRI